MVEQVRAVAKRSIPRIESIEIRNYRALRNIKLSNLNPISVFLGPNGSGKSTLCDVFAFLKECLSEDLRKPWSRRSRFKELRTRGETGPIEFRIKYREDTSTVKHQTPRITYELCINEDEDGPYVERETLAWRRGSSGRPFIFLKFENGIGEVISGDYPDEESRREPKTLDSRETIAIGALGKFSDHPRVSSLMNFIKGWHMSDIKLPDYISEGGSQEHLSTSGDNLPNVLQHLAQKHSAVLQHIQSVLVERIPRLDNVYHDELRDGRLLILIKDGPFDIPIMAKWASAGTMKMLAYLTLLYDPEPAPLIGIEEPENQIHPRLLSGLAEECTKAVKNSQLFITTHSPFFVNDLRPGDLWVLFRNEQGHTEARRASEMKGINEQIEHGAKLGDLWMEGYFPVGDPLVNHGGPRQMDLFK